MRERKKRERCVRYLQYFPAVGGIELLVAMTMNLDNVEEVPVKRYTYPTRQLHVYMTMIICMYSP